MREPRESRARARTLRELLGALDEAGVAHVYWGSPRKLERAFLDPGRDFDLLVRPSDAALADEVLAARGFKRARGPEGEEPEGVESWIGLAGDRSFVHLHRHHRCLSGRPGVLSFELPWAAKLLEGRRRHPSGAWLPAPAPLFLDRLARALLEPKHWAFGPHMAGRAGEPRLKPEVEAELCVLAAEADPAALGALLERYLADSGLVYNLPLSNLGKIDRHQLSKFRRRLFDALEPHRRLRRELADARWGAKVARSWARARYVRVFGSEAWPAPRQGLRRRGEGLFIAVIGPDGSGKSTLVRSLGEWLGEVYALHRAYFGRGDWVTEARDLAARAKWAALSLAAGRAPPPAPSEDASAGYDGAGAGSSSAHKSPPSLKARALALVHEGSRVALAQRKASDAERARRLLREGVIVLSDRFPHPTERLADGPALIPDGSLVHDAFARWERQVFGRLRGFGPDLVIALRVSPERAWARKREEPGHRLEDIRSKAAALEGLRFPGAEHLILDADRSAEEVLRAAQDAIWQRL